jgi:hypothetical protein
MRGSGMEPCANRIPASAGARLIWTKADYGGPIHLAHLGWRSQYCVIAMPSGRLPTRTVSVTLFVAVSMTDTLFEPALVA